MSIKLLTMPWWLRQRASTPKILARSQKGAICLITSCQETVVCKEGSGKDMKLCAYNCVAGLLVGWCGWVVKDDGVCIEVCWRSAICEGGSGCGQLEHKPDG